MNKLQKLLMAIFMIALFSCGDDDNDVSKDSSLSDLSLTDVSDGQAIINTTGNIEATVSGSVQLTTTGTETLNDVITFYVASYTITDGSNNAFVNVYWPESEGELMPSGDYQIAFANLNNPPSDRFVSVSVFVEDISYSTFTGSSGSATISEVNVDYEMDLIFEAEGLEQFFDDVMINAVGAVKYRN